MLLPLLSFFESCLYLVRTKYTAMKIKFTKRSSLYLIIGGAVAYLALSSNSSGITGQSTAGCGGSGCHGSSGSTATVLAITGIPGTGWTAGAAYTITATVTNTAKTAAGFDLTVTAGTVSAASSGATASGTEVRHTAPKTLTSGTASWTFTWTAPATGSSVTFRMAGNAVNLNSSADAGDVWNTATQTFNAATTSTAPAIGLQTATSITNTTATLNTTVNANGASTTVTAVYGLTTSYGSIAAVTPGTVTGTTATPVSASLTGLTPHTTYHYRFAAISSGGTTPGTDATFTTTGLSVASLSAGGFRAFPNPVKDVLMIDAGADKATMQFVLTDISGKIIPAHIWRDGAYYNIATSGLAKGLYMLRIVAGEQVYGTSFVKE